MRVHRGGGRSHCAIRRQRAARLFPELPRLIAEWDGTQWTAAALVDNYAAACRLLDSMATAAAVPVPGHSPAEPRAGGGRHRRAV
ncbi:DUF6087 family protein [Streptomyces sp. ISL-11]|uniref:DUF6087 family protein n=1 Tax=Streptomyces sp. ISL-11 TaxID=2819174 RepID=UPI0035B07A1D